MKPIYAEVGGIAILIVLVLAAWLIMRPNLETRTLQPVFSRSPSLLAPPKAKSTATSLLPHLRK